MTRLLIVALAVLSCRREDDLAVRPDRVFDAARAYEPTPVPAPSPLLTSCSATTKISPSIDKACAKQTLASADAVARATCGTAASTRVRMIFAPAGTVTSVSFEPPVPSAAESCLRATFEKCRVPPFAASSVAVGWPFPMTF